MKKLMALSALVIAVWGTAMVSPWVATWVGPGSAWADEGGGDY